MSDPDLDERTAALAAVTLELLRAPAPAPGAPRLHALAETEVLRERVPALATTLPPPGEPGALTALEQPSAPSAAADPGASSEVDPVVALLARQRWSEPVTGAALTLALPSDPSRLVVAGVLADGMRWGLLREPSGAVRGGRELAPALCDLLLTTFAA